MEYRSNSYSPDVLIYLEVGGKTIRLADVLCDTATLYGRDFDDIPPGTPAQLVFSVDKNILKKNIVLSEGLKADMGIFSFRESVLQ